MALPHPSWGSSGSPSAGSPSGSAGDPSNRTPARPHRRDRHGRGPRGPVAWPPVPAMTSRREAFDELVLDSARRLQRFVADHGGVEFAVEDVPPSDPAAWEENTVALSRLFPGRRGVRPRIVLYRRPLESRALDPRELPDLVHQVLVEQVAALLGVAPEELDPDSGPQD